jgi:hypothetical protein
MTAVARSRALPWLGKTPTTRVRRHVSRKSRSSRLVVLMRRLPGAWEVPVGEGVVQAPHKGLHRPGVAPPVARTCGLGQGPRRCRPGVPRRWQRSPLPPPQPRLWAHGPARPAGSGPGNAHVSPRAARWPPQQDGLVVIAHHQQHAPEPPVQEPPQQQTWGLPPLPSGRLHRQHLPVAILVHPHRHQQGHLPHPLAAVDLQVGGVQEQVGVGPPRPAAFARPAAPPGAAGRCG